MSKANFSEEFKRDAVRQTTERGYPVAEVSQRLGVIVTLGALIELASQIEEQSPA